MFLLSLLMSLLGNKNEIKKLTSAYVIKEIRLGKGDLKHIKTSI